MKRYVHSGYVKCQSGEAVSEVEIRQWLLNLSSLYRSLTPNPTRYLTGLEAKQSLDTQPRKPGNPA